MCRNIRVLANFEPPATEAEIRDAALQFVRKLSGTAKPSAANTQVFERAVDDVAVAATQLLRDWTTNSPPKNRDDEAQKARERTRRRFG